MQFVGCWLCAAFVLALYCTVLRQGLTPAYRIVPYCVSMHRMGVFCFVMEKGAAPLPGSFIDTIQACERIRSFYPDLDKMQVHTVVPVTPPPSVTPHSVGSVGSAAAPVTPGSAASAGGETGGSSPSPSPSLMRQISSGDKSQREGYTGPVSAAANERTNERTVRTPPQSPPVSGAAFASVNTNARFYPPLTPLSATSQLLQSQFGGASTAADSSAFGSNNHIPGGVPISGGGGGGGFHDSTTSTGSGAGGNSNGSGSGSGSGARPASIHLPASPTTTPVPVAFALPGQQPPSKPSPPLNSQPSPLNHKMDADSATASTTPTASHPQHKSSDLSPIEGSPAPSNGAGGASAAVMTSPVTPHTPPVKGDSIGSGDSEPSADADDLPS